MLRLNKAIANSGIASRRGADTLISEGRVSVNGHKISELSTTVEENAKITVNGKLLPKVASVTYMLNKPKGYVCSTRTQAKEHLVTELVPTYPKVYPVGRLDKDSEGLLLLSNDGDLTNTLTHPSFKHPKQYRVIAKWQKDAKIVTPERLVELFKKGVRLGDGEAAADQIDAKSLTDGKLVLYVTIHEGRTHLVRRLCASFGLDVTNLRRIKLASLQLGSLTPGAFRVLTPSELRHLS